MDKDEALSKAAESIFIYLADSLTKAGQLGEGSPREGKDNKVSLREEQPNRERTAAVFSACP